MSAELVSILVLAVVFVIATTRSINMGTLAFVAAFGVGTLVADMSTDAIFKGFPSSLFVVLVGVTFLFAIARANGTTDWLVHVAIRLVGGRVVLVPWVMFAITGVLTAFGAVSPAAVAIVAPIAMGFAAQHKISPLLMGAMVVHGAQAGGFSPASIYGGIVNAIVAREGLPGDEIALFLASAVANFVIAAVVFVVCGGLKLAKQPAVGQGLKTAESQRLTAAHGATLVGFAGLVVAAFFVDVGLAAMTVAVVLSIVWPKQSKQAVGQIAWPTVLLICGVLTYVGVLQTMGTIAYAGHTVAAVGTPMIAALLICYVGAVVSAFASSVGIMGALIPLAVPFLLQGEVSAVGMVAALAVSATVVDVSPFSTNGALVLAGAQDIDRDRFFKQLMAYGGIIVVVAPPLVWLALVVLATAG